MNVPLILRDEPFTEPTEVTLPEGVVTVNEFSEAVSLADLPAIFDAGYSSLAEAGPIGPGYALYSGPPSGWFDLEIGFPVAAAPAGFTAGTFPAGRALALSHVGPYDTLGDSWGSLMESFAARDLGEPRLIAEVYATDPSVTPAADLRTDLFVLY
ncbi:MULTISPECIES: GyrI-like domain-containing protein [unclassified Gordonia (in: high G+C Gram-positive bacteria)]|uniref:GyrI-like domain-containing protein n=1 Tax=unclassified Gordonia (in: high G+C Gram-positive bacteria) TaxID=2657482 RepID=UPI001FFF55E6|nr:MULTISPECIES: GyrI-like domain-containing protein [unclassified Gordonia (in: high G+C Gram-positive bacteria)]UQE74685.1 GyrI-like domain-containing protein [Gordonia sp. PP30]